jgi:hypothetical protein
LSYNELTGPLPKEWGSFKELTWLGLWGNRLHGSIPSSWGALSKTAVNKVLLFNNSGLVGCLPEGFEKFKGGIDVCEGTGLTCSIC